MAEAAPGGDEAEYEQCRAITDDGDRCSRPAGDDGFCYQHGPDNETVDDQQVDGGQQTEEEAADSDDADESQSTDDSEAGDAEETESAGTEDESSDAGEPEPDASDQSFGIGDVRESVQAVTDNLIGQPFDGVVEVEKVDDGWRAAVEVIERKSVPDTQDILGRYELTLDDGGTPTGYRLTDRYRRGDTSGEPVE